MVIRKKNFLIFGSLGLIIIGIILASIIDRVTSANNGPNDIRARAGVTKYLTANATVVSSNSTRGILTVTDLYLTDQSRSGDATNLGSWIITAPASFDYSSVSPASAIVIGINPSSFNVSARTFTAATITIQK